MKIFDVYSHPVNGFESIKQGFSWPAFFFPVVWALFKKMWVNALVLVGVVFMIEFIAGVLIGSGTNLDSVQSFTLFMTIAVSVLLGFKGNELRSQHVSEKGYSKVGTYTAANGSSAIAQAAKELI